MFRQILAASAVLIACAAAPALARDYVLLKIEDDSSKAIVMDYGSVATAHDNIRQSWILTVLQGDKVVDGVIRVRALWQYNCTTQRAAVRTVEQYTAPGAAPAAARTLDDSEMNWAAVNPGSIIADARDYTCGVRTPAPAARVVGKDDDDLTAIYSNLYNLHQNPK